MVNKPQKSGQVRILIPLADGEKPTLEPELIKDEYTIIGMISVQWSMLEHSLLTTTLEYAEGYGEQLPKDATNLSFTRRLRAWRLLVEANEPNDDKQKTILNLISRIANAEGQRHKIIHGLWDWDTTNPSKLIASSQRPPHLFDHPTSLSKLVELHTAIGVLNYELLYGDKDPRELHFEFLKESANEDGSVAYVSRQFLLSITRKDHDTPDRHPSTPPKRKRHPPSSD